MHLIRGRITHAAHATIFVNNNVCNMNSIFSDSLLELFYQNIEKELFFLFLLIENKLFRSFLS